MESWMNGRASTEKIVEYKDVGYVFFYQKKKREKF